ncbi:MAG TPA: hypothetical protein VMW73_07775 [Spirochaetia bacterium]|nr:hypothetical protein [Spirochaetia bacterium]
MKRWMTVTFAVVLVVGAGVGISGFYSQSTSRWLKSVTWSDPSLASVPDGEYTGSAHLDMPAGTAAANSRATVRVTVRSGRYVAVAVSEPAPIAKSMTDYAQLIVVNQSLRPDVISGATATKVVTLMAVANAIEGM